MIMTGMEEVKEENAIRELLEKREEYGTTPEDEIILIETEMLELSKKMKLLNGKLIKVLQETKRDFEANKGRENATQNPQIPNNTKLIG